MQVYTAKYYCWHDISNQLYTAVLLQKYQDISRSECIIFNYLLFLVK